MRRHLGEGNAIRYLVFIRPHQLDALSDAVTSDVPKVQMRRHLGEGNAIRYLVFIRPPPTGYNKQRSHVNLMKIPNFFVAAQNVVLSTFATQKLLPAVVVGLLSDTSLRMSLYAAARHFTCASN